MRKVNLLATLIFFVVLIIFCAIALLRYSVSLDPYNSWIGIAGFFVALLLAASIKIADQWERATVLTLGYQCHFC